MSMLLSLSLANFALSLGIVMWLGWNRKRILSGNGNGSVTPRQYDRLVARLDRFELTIATQVKDDQSFRRDVIDVNAKQLDATQQQNKILAKVLARTEYVASTLETRPCLLNEDDNCFKGFKGK